LAVFNNTSEALTKSKNRLKKKLRSHIIPPLDYLKKLNLHETKIERKKKKEKRRCRTHEQEICCLVKWNFSRKEQLAVFNNTSEALTKSKKPIPFLAGKVRAKRILFQLDQHRKGIGLAFVFNR